MAPIRVTKPFEDDHSLDSFAPNNSASAWVKFLRLRDVRADGLDGRILAARVSSKDDGVSLAESDEPPNQPIHIKTSKKEQPLKSPA